MKKERFLGFTMKSRACQVLALTTTVVLLAGCHKSDSTSQTAKSDAAQSDTNAAASTTTQPSTPDQQQPATAAPAQSATPSTTDDATQQASIAAISTQFQWPRTYKDGATTLLMYQPEIEKWNGFDFQARFALKGTATKQSEVC
jgi:hypothetical protein